MFKYQDNILLQTSLIPNLNEMKLKLQNLSREHLVKTSGVKCIDDRIFIDIFSRTFEIDGDSFNIYNNEKKLESVLLHCIVFSYLISADGIPRSNSWISFRELPDGNKYCHAFQVYAPDRLSKQWGLNIDGFSEACLKSGGKKIDIGDAAYIFKVFPNIELAVVYWNGDELYPSKASILFDKNISHYMVTAGLATIGNELVDMILMNK